MLKPHLRRTIDQTSVSFIVAQQFLWILVSLAFNSGLEEQKLCISPIFPALSEEVL